MVVRCAPFLLSKENITSWWGIGRSVAKHNSIFELWDMPIWSSSATTGAIPIAIRLVRWIRSKLLAITTLRSSAATAFAAQSRLEPEQYLLPAKITDQLFRFRWKSAAFGSVKISLSAISVDLGGMSVAKRFCTGFFVNKPLRVTSQLPR